MESVQRRATKLIPAVGDELYEDRLRCSVKLTTLETREERGDLILINIYRDSDDLDPFYYFYLSRPHTRGHSLKLIKSQCFLDIS
jgi:hypothetical protein